MMELKLEYLKFGLCAKIK